MHIPASTYRILRWASVALMAVIVVLLMIEGTWGLRLYHHPVFIALVVAMLVPLGIVSVRDFGAGRYGLVCSHGGLLLVLGAGMLGAPFTTDVQILLYHDTPERVAYTTEGHAFLLPFSMTLQDYETTYYEDGVSPKQYRSVLRIGDTTSETSVNHPLRYRGWYIYQADYDPERGEYVVLKMVRDPWLWPVYVGFGLMAIGALIDLRRAWHSWKVIPVVLVLAAVFTALSLMRIQLGHLPPALRSLWFFPHILIYMLAYSLMAIAVVWALYDAIAKHRADRHPVVDKLLATASALLLIGMLCGAVWAKQTWGQYWTWDAKECWAAATWLLTVMAAHIRQGKWKIVVLLLSFGAIQMTWYGVNYLPAARNSMHTYTQQ